MAQRVAIIVGRFNPPTRGHWNLVEQLKTTARDLQAQPVVYVVDGALSRDDLVRNPLTGAQRVDIIKGWFPDVSVNTVGSAYSVTDIVKLHDMQLVAWIAGSDRADKYGKLLQHAGITEARMVSVDRTQGDAPGVSATLVRQAAMENNWRQFVHMMPRQVSPRSLDTVWQLIRRAGNNDIRQSGLRDHSNQ